MKSKKNSTLRFSQKKNRLLETKKSKTIGDLIYEIEKFLAGKVENPSFSAKYILSEILQMPIPELNFQVEKLVVPQKIKKIISAAKRRSKDEPLQYIFGRAYFRNLVLKVGRGVLIPRPETELMVDEILKGLPQGGTFCDIGTGSGAIALSIASERPDTTVFASEISTNALKYAIYNQKKFKLKNVFIRKGSLFAPLKNQKFDVIAANLPYIKDSDIPKLPCEVRKFEPESALRAGIDGLDIIRQFFRDAIAHSKKNTFIIAEIAPEQKRTIKSFLKKISIYSKIRFIKDLNGKNRFVIIWRFDNRVIDD